MQGGRTSLPTVSITSKRRTTISGTIGKKVFSRRLRGLRRLLIGGHMKHKIVFAVLSWLSASAVLPGQALAQQCVPAAQPATQAGGGRGAAQQQRIPRDAAVTQIPGVVSAGATWTKIWQ